MASSESSSSEMACAQARRLFVDYMEGDLASAMAERLSQHLESCPHCQTVFAGIKNVVGLLGKLADFDLPAEFKSRNYSPSDAVDLDG
ncbi:MAG TPA: zf-HC2 domain-containing protein [Terracidiphilus sp.]|jgi:anti-sigma factor RsiW|nr:zf-HC2 domain-containing protein [Terracidiphilus sp.]